MSERREHIRNLIRMTGFYLLRNPFILWTHEILMRHRHREGRMPHKKCTSRRPLTENLPTPHATFTHLDILGEYRYALVECLPDESKIALSCCRALSTS